MLSNEKERPRPLFFLLIAAVIASEAFAQSAPEGTTGRESKPVLAARRQMVVAAHPLAADAGYAVLKRGGNALDAAIATQMVLNLVEPQSSGIGGGAFLLHYSARERRLRVYDGRETAPAAATEALFLDANGAPMGYFRAIVGGRSVGVPGVVAMLAMAHKRHGRLAWQSLFDSAIMHARDGFPISPRLSALVARDPGLGRDADARKLFYDVEGRALAAGTLSRNPALAATFTQIAARGAVAMREGPIADAIVAAVRGHQDNPGSLTLADLAAYRPIEREPLCAPYLGRRVCSAPPPTSGGVAVLQILKLLEDRPLARAGDLMSAHLYAEASRLAFADRDRYLADPAFVPVPTAGLLDERYLATRRATIDPRRSIGEAAPGKLGAARASGVSLEAESTSHLSVSDAQGDIVSLTSSIESAFGARIMAAGFLLNNQLTDFSFRPEADGALVANRVQPGKRPRSSMAPVIVFDASGQPIIAIGSPGGPLIISYVARTLVEVLARGKTLQAAVELSHVANRNGATELERGTGAESLANGLDLLGHRTRLNDMTSGLHGFERVKGPRGEMLWRSGIDPRREGAARGD